MDDLVDNILTYAEATHIEKKPGVPLTFKYDPAESLTFLTTF